jgi:NADH:ubiquinone oxidoreductase subunit H
VFSVISGVVLVIAAMVPGLSARDRLWSLVIGAGSIAYGIYVANQTSGTYYFSWVIFVIPPGAVLYVIATAVAHHRERTKAASRSGQEN